MKNFKIFKYFVRFLILKHILSTAYCLFPKIFGHLWAASGLMAYFDIGNFCIENQNCLTRKSELLIQQRYNLFELSIQSRL